MRTDHTLLPLLGIPLLRLRRGAIGTSALPLLVTSTVGLILLPADKDARPIPMPRLQCAYCGRLSSLQPEGVQMLLPVV